MKKILERIVMPNLFRHLYNFEFDINFRVEKTLKQVQGDNLCKHTLVILLLFIMGTVFSLPVNAEIKKEAGFISLNSSQVKEIEPNLATVTFAVENTAEEAQKAVSKNNEISDKIIKALKQVSSSNTDIIKTTGFSLRPVYATTATGKRVIKNYTAVNSVRVETKDVQKVAKFIDVAINNGANRTDNLVYSLQNEKKVCAQLYPELAKELTDMAKEIALSTGMTFDGLKYMNVSCNTDNVSNGRYFTKAMLASGAQDTEEAAISAPVEAGKIKLRVYVNADFYVK